MKTVRIRGFYRLPLLLIILMVIGLPMMAWLFCIGIIRGEPLLVAMGVLFFGIIFIGLGFFFCFGIKIGKKRVVIIDFQELRVFRREEITKFDIIFDKNSIRVEIKAHGEKLYQNVFGDFTLSLVYPRLWRVRCKVSEKFVAKSQKLLENCDKVRAVDLTKIG